MADQLAVWLYGDCVALVDRERGRPRLTYTQAALDRFPLGSPVLSLRMTIRPERYPQGVVRPFLDGLLPEGQARLAVAADFGLDPTNTFEMLRAIGRDCAGAVVIQPADEPAPPSPPTTLKAAPITTDEIEQLVRNLRTAPLGVDEHVRVSLGGVQEKLLLTRMPGGTWGRPVDGTPSTHIVKPEMARYPGMVENEAFCMTIAKRLGLRVADIEIIDIGSRRLLSVARFDRIVHRDGSVERIHQEDFCQALGMLPDHKYQYQGGPSFRRIADSLSEFADQDSLRDLVKAMTLNTLVGNGDAHGKNFSVVHSPSGALSLAPLYDVVSTLHYGDVDLAMHVDNVHKTNRVTVEGLINEATSWGLSKSEATSLVHEVLNDADKAIAAARAETVGLSDAIVKTVENQRKQLLS